MGSPHGLFCLCPSGHLYLKMLTVEVTDPFETPAERTPGKDWKENKG